MFIKDSQAYFKFDFPEEVFNMSCRVWVKVSTVIRMDTAYMYRGGPIRCHWDTGYLATEL